MEITNAAVNEILKVMRRNQLDPNFFYLEFDVVDSKIVMEFTPNVYRTPMCFGELKIVPFPDDQVNLKIDYVKNEEREGFLFLEV